MPVDPRLVVDGPLDPSLTSVLGALGPYRQRLWIRRIVRRTWLALAAILVAELVLWTVARFVPLTWAPVAAVLIPAVGIFAWLVAIVRARPGIGETALAVDGEGQLGDRVSSALELAAAFPTSAGPADPEAVELATGPMRRRPTGSSGDNAPMRSARSAWPRPACSSRGSRNGPPGHRRSRPCCSSRRSSSRIRRTASSPSSGRSQRPPIDRPIDSTNSPRNSTRRARTRRIRGRDWPRNCASSPDSCATSRPTST